MRILFVISISVFGILACNSHQSKTNYAEIDTAKVEDIIDTVVIQDTDIITDTISICLPYPNDTFFSLKLKNFKTNDTINTVYYDEIYWYLITNLDSIAPKHVIEKTMAYDEYEMITKWEQHFTKDINYVKYEGIESGTTTYLFSHCKNKAEFFKTIAPIIEFQKLDSTYYNPEMSWNYDSTQYESIEGEAGCYYEIKKDSVENYMLEWYCGC